MNIKASLTIKFTSVVVAILIVFSVVTYQFFSAFRESSFKTNLKNVSQNLVLNYMVQEELTPEILKLIFEKQLNRYTQEALIIADENHEVVFNSGKIKNTEIDLLKQLYKKGNEIELSVGDTEFVSYIVPHDGANFYVVTSAIDSTGNTKLQYLGILLILVNFGAIFIAIISGWYLSKQALQPINNVIAQVETINESNLNQRVNEGNGNDEIAHLGIVFNKMLGRIEKSFIFQKLFVANASHEFRTPLTIIKGQIQVLLLKSRTEEEYIKTFCSIQDDIQNLISLLNSLNELASANADFPYIHFKNISIVEVIMDSKEELAKRKPHYKISLEWGDFPEEDDLMEIMADYSLLKSAFMNLMDNACKFSSDNSCVTKVNFNKFNIEIIVSDHGPGIAKSDLPNIFLPFYRSNETRNIPGYGIGLSLVKKTIELHKGEISVISEPENGTSIQVTLNNNFLEEEF